MAVDIQHGNIIFICDECDDSFNAKEPDFYTALALTKAEGWIVKRNDDDTAWTHICNECAQREEVMNVLWKIITVEQRCPECSNKHGFIYTNLCVHYRSSSRSEHSMSAVWINIHAGHRTERREVDTMTTEIKVLINTIQPAGYSPMDVGLAFTRALPKLLKLRGISPQDKIIFENAVVSLQDEVLVRTIPHRT